MMRPMQQLVIFDVNGSGSVWRSLFGCNFVDELRCTISMDTQDMRCNFSIVLRSECVQHHKQQIET